MRNKILIQRAYHTLGYEVVRFRDDLVYSFKEQDFHKHSMGDIYRSDDRLILEKEELQDIANELASIGIYPKEMEANDLIIKEKDKHLQDMRKIVSKKLGVNL